MGKVHEWFESLSASVRSQLVLLTVFTCTLSTAFTRYPPVATGLPWHERLLDHVAIPYHAIVNLLTGLPLANDHKGFLLVVVGTPVLNALLCLLHPVLRRELMDSLVAENGPWPTADNVSIDSKNRKR